LESRASGGGLHDEGQPGEGLTLLSAFKAEMNKVFQQKEAVA